VTSPAPAIGLHPFGREDFSRLIGWVSPGGSQETLVQWAGPIFRWPLDRAQLDEYVAPSLAEPPERMIWRADAAGAAAGHIELNKIDREGRSAVLSRVLVDPARRGDGLSRAMVAAALDMAFGHPALHRVALNVFDFNEPAIRCYRSLGFVDEGLQRDTYRVNGTYWSTIRMSLLEDEWRRRPTP